MSEKIDPREVLAYLNELGYTNITAQQLKEFVKDLKKIIKYDSRYGGTMTTGTSEQQGEQSCFGQESKCFGEGFDCSESDEKENYSDKENQTDNVQTYTQNTQTNNARNIQKDKHIAVHIYNSKNQKYLNHEHCLHINEAENCQCQYAETKLKVGCNKDSTSTKPGTTESTIKSIPPNSTRETVHSRASRTSNKDRKSKVAFIRSAIPKPSINKSDPVALYHYYQSQWKKINIPGQENRDDLRWAIRERMLGGPRVEVKSRCNIPRCGWSR